VAGWVMQWGGAVKVLEPLELKEMVAGMARKILAYDSGARK
jgi:predicted DNA-binding transcriptional regulator YafY